VAGSSPKTRSAALGKLDKAGPMGMGHFSPVRRGKAFDKRRATRDRVPESPSVHQRTTARAPAMPPQSIQVEFMAAMMIYGCIFLQGG
jgi:hypothetical protein